MTLNVLWSLPVPTSALLDDGVHFEKRQRRTVALIFSYESETTDNVVLGTVTFEDVEAFKATYYRARGTSMEVAYERLVDCGNTPWLEEAKENLRRNGAAAEDLKHLMINFDDGPCYEFLCRGFAAEAA